jgi:hypothetical protein
MSLFGMSGCQKSPPPESAPASAPSFPPVQFTSPNLLLGARIVYESLRIDEEPDAIHLLEDNDLCWTPQDPARKPAKGHPDVLNSVVEIALERESTFNIAVIEEVDNEAQYFRLQANVGGKWQTIYQSEKIQTLRLCGFDPVTTGRVRLSIDKFRSSETPVKIKSLKLYNEPARPSKNFDVAVYQRLDGDVPSEVLARGEDYARMYARFYDVYSTVIVFAAVNWDKDGNIRFNRGEDVFARELEALRRLISMRSNQGHKVKILVTALADGAWREEGGVNMYMARLWELIADKIADFAKKYDLDGVDIDWEFPQSKEDWLLFDSFIARLDDRLGQAKPGAIISAALSAWGHGMQKETFDRIGRIQLMTYDGTLWDRDGYQSSLNQAQGDLVFMINKGADLSKINIGIAAYGRPLNDAPFWAAWRDLPSANYWESKYYNVLDRGQIYDGAFCSPALAGDKTAYALYSGAGGVMVFRLACDKTMDDPNSVARGIENALRRCFTDW